MLETVLNDGIEGICLMTFEGSLMCSAQSRENPTKVKDTLLAAISSSIFLGMLQGNSISILMCFWHLFIMLKIKRVGNSDIMFQIIAFENGSLAIVPIGKKYILVAEGTNVTLGLLRGRLLALSQYFSRIFEQST